MDSERLLETMVHAAKDAGAFQLSEFRRRTPGWGDAKTASDFVSFVDVESEKMIRRSLSEALPSAAFYGEETDQNLGPDATWVVDPLDGTTNYLSGFDHWSVSIALWDQLGPRLGAVLKPPTGELFTAIRGRGAWRDGVPLRQAEVMEAKSALIATGTPYRSPKTMDAFSETLRRVLSTCRDIRRTGSAALDLCYLAAGFFQGFWEVDLQPYDVAAGLLMLNETGHRSYSFLGADYNPFLHNSLVTGRPGVLEKLRTVVLNVYPARWDA